MASYINMKDTSSPGKESYSYKNHNICIVILRKNKYKRRRLHDKKEEEQKGQAQRQNKEISRQVGQTYFLWRKIDKNQGKSLYHLIFRISSRNGSGKGGCDLGKYYL